MTVEDLDGPTKAGRTHKGRFVKGSTGNRAGRPPKSRSDGFGEAVIKATAKKVKVIEGGSSKWMRKIDLAATQLANQGASGDKQAIRLAADMTRHFEGKDTEPHQLVHTDADMAIVARLARRMRGEED